MTANKQQEAEPMRAQVNGTELYYETLGQGRPLMLMHGGLGLDHTAFTPGFNQLGDQVELIYYDHRGNGRSERPASFDNLTHETWIADADALRAHLGHERMILFGHSYGGFLAQDYAIRYGDHLDGLILCNTAPALDYMDVVMANAAARGTPEQLTALGQLFGRPMTDDADFQQMWGEIAPLYFKHFNAEAAAAIDETTLYSAAAWNHVNANCLPLFNTLDRLNEIKTPTLIISGADDWITPPAQGGERIHAALPNSELVIFEESGHWPFIEEPDKFMTVVRKWIGSLA